MDPLRSNCFLFCNLVYFIITFSQFCSTIVHTGDIEKTIFRMFMFVCNCMFCSAQTGFVVTWVELLTCVMFELNTEDRSN